MQLDHRLAVGPDHVKVLGPVIVWVDDEPQDVESQHGRHDHSKNPSAREIAAHESEGAAGEAGARTLSPSRRVRERVLCSLLRQKWRCDPAAPP